MGSAWNGNGIVKVNKKNKCTKCSNTCSRVELIVNMQLKDQKRQFCTCKTLNVAKLYGF